MTKIQLDPYKNQLCKCNHIRGDHYFLTGQCAHPECKHKCISFTPLPDKGEAYLEHTHKDINSAGELR